MSRSRPARPQQPLTSGAQWAHLGPAVSAQSSSEQLASSGWPDASRAADGSTSGPVEPWSDAGRQNVSPHSAEQPRTHDRSEPSLRASAARRMRPRPVRAAPVERRSRAGDWAHWGADPRARGTGGAAVAAGGEHPPGGHAAVPVDRVPPPGLPEDPYGFQAEDRMILGSHGMDYVLNWAPGPFLGRCAPRPGGHGSRRRRSPT